MKKTIIIFGALTVSVLVLIEFSTFSIRSNSFSKDWIVSIVAVLFIIIGYYLSKLFRDDSEIGGKGEEINKENQRKIGLSEREYEIFQLMARGLSNAEIGSSLFISEHTVKSHVSKIFMKLQAKRRTQAIQIGRELKIIQ